MSERVTVGRIVLSTTGPAPDAAPRFDHGTGAALAHITNEVRELRDECESWRTRFQAIVGANRPDSAGNEVLHIMDRLKATTEALRAASGAAYALQAILKDEPSLAVIMPGLPAVIERIEGALK